MVSFPRFSRPLLPTAFTALLVLGISGCGDSKRFFEVKGTATHAGKPVANVVLHFSDPTGWQGAVDTDADGHFELRFSAKKTSFETRVCTVWISGRPRAKVDPAGNPRAKPIPDPLLEMLIQKYGSSTPKTVEIQSSELIVDFN